MKMMTMMMTTNQKTNGAAGTMMTMMNPGANAIALTMRMRMMTNPEKRNTAGTMMTRKMRSREADGTARMTMMTMRMRSQQSHQEAVSTETLLKTNVQPIEESLVKILMIMMSAMIVKSGELVQRHTRKERNK